MVLTVPTTGCVVRGLIGAISGGRMRAPVTQPDTTYPGNLVATTHPARGAGRGVCPGCGAGRVLCQAAAPGGPFRRPPGRGR